MSNPSNSTKGFLPSHLHPVAVLLLLVGLIVGGFCVAMFLAVAAGLLFFGVGLAEVGNITQNPAASPNGWAVSMMYQGLLLFVGLGGAALLVPRLLGQSWARYFAPRRPVPALWLLTAALLVLVSVPFMSGLIEWNAQVHFPAFLHDFEVWARTKEDQAQELTKTLTQFTSVGRLLVGLLVIAVVPAICEELVFRGVVQRNLVQLTGSRHVGVWLAAAIFSAIHVQFFGFVPRFILGLGLGYLYEWSGNILVPMAAHFTQNAFQVILLYAVQHGAFQTSDFDPDSTQALPWPQQLVSLLLTGALLWLFYQRTQATGALPTEMHTLSRGGAAVARPTDAPATGRTLDHRGIDVSQQG